MQLELNKVKKDKSEWHSWFAWHPVVAKNSEGKDILVWLETIERKITISVEWIPDFSSYEATRRVIKTAEYNIPAIHFYC